MKCLLAPLAKCLYTIHGGGGSVEGEEQVLRLVDSAAFASWLAEQGWPEYLFYPFLLLPPTPPY